MVSQRANGLDTQGCRLSRGLYIMLWGCALVVPPRAILDADLGSNNTPVPISGQYGGIQEVLPPKEPVARKLKNSRHERVGRDVA